MVQRHLEQALAGLTGQRRSPDAHLLDLDVVVGQQLVDEIAVLGGNAVGQLVEAEVLALALVFGRHDDVHAVGLAVDVLVDPAQFLLELVGPERHPAEHTQPTGVGHRGDDIAAMAEGEQRELDAVGVADRCLHSPSITLPG